jgi:hypothetical protein
MRWVGSQKGNDAAMGTREQVQHCIRVHLLNIVHHHYPGVRADQFETSCYSGQQSPSRDFPSPKVIQRPHLHLIIVAVSCTHLPSNHHLGYADTLLGKPLPVILFLGKPFHFSEIAAGMCIALA